MWNSPKMNTAVTRKELAVVVVVMSVLQALGGALL